MPGVGGAPYSGSTWVTFLRCGVVDFMLFFVGSARYAGPVPSVVPGPNGGQRGRSGFLAHDIIMVSVQI